MFFKTGSGSPALAAARVAKGRTLKIQRTGSVSGEGSVFGSAGSLLTLLEVTFFPKSTAKNGYLDLRSLGTAVMRCCSAAAKYKCCGVAVLLCNGRKEAGMRVEVRARGGAGSRQGKGKVCFGFLLPDESCSSDYDHGQRYTPEINKLKLDHVLYFHTNHLLLFIKELRLPLVYFQGAGWTAIAVGPKVKRVCHGLTMSRG